MKEKALKELKEFRLKVAKVHDLRGTNADKCEIIEIVDSLSEIIDDNLLDELMMMKLLKNVREQQVAVNSYLSRNQ